MWLADGLLDPNNFNFFELDNRVRYIESWMYDKFGHLFPFFVEYVGQLEKENTLQNMVNVQI